MKKRVLITVSVVLLLIAVLCLFTFQSSQQDLPHEAVTDIYPFTLSDKAGSTITIYICQTRYHPETIQVTGLNVDAISSVFDIENTVLQKEFDTYGHPAAIYQGKTILICVGQPAPMSPVFWNMKQVPYLRTI